MRRDAHMTGYCSEEIHRSFIPARPLHITYEILPSRRGFACTASPISGIVVRPTKHYYFAENLTLVITHLQSTKRLFTGIWHRRCYLSNRQPNGKYLRKDFDMKTFDPIKCPGTLGRECFNLPRSRLCLTSARSWHYKSVDFSTTTEGETETAEDEEALMVNWLAAAG